MRTLKTLAVIAFSLSLSLTPSASVFAVDQNGLDHASTQGIDASAPHIYPIIGASLPANAKAVSTYATPSAQYGIQYHGGPVMTASPTNIYVIYYGNWATAKTTTQSILTTFLGALNGSKYYNINTTYVDGSLVPIKNSLAVVKTIVDTYSLGTTKKTLSDTDIWTIVSNHLNKGDFVKDPNGVYFVLTSSDIAESSGFLTRYCGWHTYRTYLNTAIKYSFVGDASKNLNACAYQTTQSPNGNPAADAMASVIAHELEETVTDPQLNAWYDSAGAENGDKCAWKFGTMYSVSNGSSANMNLGGKDYLIQQNWLNTAPSGICALSY